MGVLQSGGWKLRKVRFHCRFHSLRWAWRYFHGYSELFELYALCIMVLASALGLAPQLLLPIASRRQFLFLSPHCPLLQRLRAFRRVQCELSTQYMVVLGSFLACNPSYARHANPYRKAKHHSGARFFCMLVQVIAVRFADLRLCLRRIIK